MKNNKGITLIALIITIIVMMILVAVTVAIVVNSDLIGTAQGAKTNTELAYGEESNIAGFNVTIGGEEKYFNNAEEYVDYLNGNGGADDGAIQVETNPTHRFSIGDLVFLVDNTTTWQECATASEGALAIQTSTSWDENHGEIRITIGDSVGDLTSINWHTTSGFSTYEKAAQSINAPVIDYTWVMQSSFTWFSHDEAGGTTEEALRNYASSNGWLVSTTEII